MNSFKADTRSESRYQAQSRLARKVTKTALGANIRKKIDGISRHSDAIYYHQIMPHQRNRHILPFIQKQVSLWPVVGVLGLRQVGKSTLIRDLLGVKNYVTFDDDDVRGDAAASPKTFLAKMDLPLAIDEVQKVPEIFDAVKSHVDRKKIPGVFT